MIEELDLEQNQATTIHEDNDGGLLMVNDQQFTCCTCNLDIKYFSPLYLVQSYLTILYSIKTHNNMFDALK